MSDIIVTLPSGAPFPVLTEDEERYLYDKIDEYRTAFKFENVSDLAELDRVVTLELLIYRMGVWLGRQADYDGNPTFDPKDLRRDLKDASTELRQIKKALGIDKASRDRARGEGSVYQRVETLLQRARAFELHRCRQSERSIELCNQLISLVQLHYNTADVPAEQKEMRVTAPEIVEWVWTVLKPEMEEIDRHFRETEQHYWHAADGAVIT